MAQAVSFGQSREMKFALALLEKTGPVAMKYFSPDVQVTWKGDDTPVTAADKEIELIIRQELAQAFPDDLVLGEEHGATERAGATRRWIIDPIDGTYNFTRQTEIFATLLALEVEGKIVLGLIHAPAMNETYWAEQGLGAYLNGKRLQVSSIAELSRAQFVYGAPSRILDLGYWEGYSRIVKQTYRQRCVGDYLNFGWVFQGKAECALEMGVKPWDLAPMKILVEEAGGRYSDLDGGDSIYTGSCLVSNGLLHDEFRRLLCGD